MSYSSDLIFHVTFDAQPFSNGLTSTFFTAYGATPTVETAVFNGGWAMDDSVYVRSTDPINFSSQMTIGFWLKSVNPGIVTHPTSSGNIPLKMPVLSKAHFAEGSVTTTTALTFIVWEETRTDGDNVMKVQIRGTRSAATVEAVLTSSPYEVGDFKHFWITFNGASSGSLKLFVDAIEDTGASISGTVPSTLSSNSAPLSINNNVIGYRYEIARNQGTIDDLVIFNTAKTSATTIRRAANQGALYVADSTLVLVEEIDHVAVFDDPGTAQVNAVHGNRGKVYVARSDGKLLRGNKLIWESRREFSDALESENLITVAKGASGYATVSDGFLKVKDRIVRA